MSHVGGAPAVGDAVQVEPGPAACHPSNTEDVVMAMWNSSGSRPLCLRSASVWASASMKDLKLAARLACSAAIDPESSTTNRMSAVERLDSWMRDAPGWMMHLPTGLKL